MCYLVPGPLPCPEVATVFYIRQAEVPTLFSVEGDAQVEQQNTVVGFLTYSESSVSLECEQLLSQDEESSMSSSRTRVSAK